MACWMSIEIFNGAFGAHMWADAHGDALIETALSTGAIDWELKRTAWGVVFEVAFPTEAGWQHYKLTDAFRNALQTAPDPYRGVLIYRGRSLDSGNASPRKPKPRIGSGSAALTLTPSPRDEFAVFPAWHADGTTSVDPRILTAVRQ